MNVSSTQGIFIGTDERIDSIRPVLAESLTSGMTLSYGSCTSSGEMIISESALEFADASTFLPGTDSSVVLPYTAQWNQVTVQGIGDPRVSTGSIITFDPLHNTSNFSMLDTGTTAVGEEYRTYSMNQNAMDEANRITSGFHLSDLECGIVAVACETEALYGRDDLYIVLSKSDFVLMMVCAYRGWQFILTDPSSESHTTSQTCPHEGEQLQMLL